MAVLLFVAILTTTIVHSECHVEKKMVTVNPVNWRTIYLAFREATSAFTKNPDTVFTIQIPEGTYDVTPRRWWQPVVRLVMILWFLFNLFYFAIILITYETEQRKNATFMEDLKYYKKKWLGDIAYQWSPNQLSHNARVDQWKYFPSYEIGCTTNFEV